MNPIKRKILFVTTGRINPDGKLYYPPLVAAQIKSLSPFLEQYQIVIVHSFRLSMLWKTFQEIRQHARTADLVHAQYGSFTAFLAWLGRRHRPLVISFGGSDLLGTGATGFLPELRNKVTYFLGYCAARSSARIIVKSRNLLDVLATGLRTKSIVVPNGVDLSIFYPVDKAKARHELKWEETSPYIVFTPSRANNVIVKNVSLAEAIVERVKRKLPNTKLELILDKSPKEVADMMNAADCLLLTSLHEGSPNVVKEAMACNLPAVTTSVGDISERLADVMPSFVVDSYDPEILSEKVLEIFRINRRSNGLEALWRQQLDGASTAARIAALYNEILEPSSAS